MPFAAADTIRRGRLGPGELLLVEPGRRADPGGHRGQGLGAPRAAASTTRRGRSTRTAGEAAARGDARVPTARPRRALSRRARCRAGRLDIKTMALEAHEPLWSMGDDTPTPGRGRLDRPVADHLRQAFAQVTNPADRPGARADRDGPAGRARPPAGAARRAPARPADRSAWNGRSSPTSTGCSRALRARGARVAELDATWAADDGRGRLSPALDRLALGCRPAVGGRRRSAGRPDRCRVVDRPAAGPVASSPPAPSTPR